MPPSPVPTDGLALPAWIAHQREIAADALLRAISATDMVCERPGFGQRIVPARGSILAARQVAFYDPDPDYFFHWLRDSAVIVDALRCLLGDDTRRDEAGAKFADYLRFSLHLLELDGSRLAATGFREHVDRSVVQYLRPEAELRVAAGERLLGETRFNPDGTLDILKWPRPQNDGPAMRALALLRCRRTSIARDPEVHRLVHALVRADLRYTVDTHATPCFDIWEEELCDPYYTRLVQHAALLEGTAWARELDDADGAGRFEAAAHELEAALTRHWSAGHGCYLSRAGVRTGGDQSKLLDMSTLLAVLHAGLPDGRHSVLDPRVHATWLQLEQLFRAGYPINQDLPPGFGPAIGRYKGDVYYRGGAWYVTTLAIAELYYRLAGAVAQGAALTVTPENAAFLAGCGYVGGPQDARLVEVLLQNGDAFMATVRRFTPPDGALSEQFDRETGVQRSARHLSWSYAAFVTAAQARRRATGAHSG